MEKDKGRKVVIMDKTNIKKNGQHYLMQINL